MTNKYIKIYYNIENYQIYFVNQGVFTLKTTKWMLVGALTLSLSGTILSSADAVILDDPTIYGGWSEDTGYFTLRQDSDISSFAIGNPIHSATKDYTRRGSAVYERVIANTTWPGVYHYSRARYESAISGRAEADSGRVWGFGTTQAISGWHPGDLGWVAKTYYGK